MGGGPPCFRQGFSCPDVLRILLWVFWFRLRGFHTLWRDFPNPSATIASITLCSPLPRSACTSVWPLAPSLAATKAIDVSFSSCRYLDVSVHDVPSVQLCIYCTVTEVFSVGFPHSDISGSLAMCASPKLFAAFCVLHRFLMPRHSPFALISLTCLFKIFSEFFILRINSF